MTQEFANTLDFPAVTLCNYNRVHCGNLYDRIIEVNRTSDPNVVQRLDSLCYLFELGQCWLAVTLEDLRREGSKVKEEICKDRPFEFNEEASSYFDVSEVAAETLASTFYQMPRDDQLAIAQRPDQMIKACKYMAISDDTVWPGVQFLVQVFLMSVTR